MERFYVKSFGCRASQADGAALESALSARGLIADRRCNRRRPGGAEHLHRHRDRRRRSAPDRAPHSSRASAGAHPGDRLLCAARAGGDRRAAWRVLVVGNSHKTRIPEFVSEPLHITADGSGRYFRAARFLAQPGRRCAGRSHASESEDSGRVQQPLLLLHYSVRARTQPQRSRRGRDRAGARGWPKSTKRWCSAASISAAGAAISIRQLLVQSRGWCIWCAACLRRQRWSGCG